MLERLKRLDYRGYDCTGTVIHKPVSRITEKAMNNIVEVKARGAQVLALAVKVNRAVLAQADDVIYIPDLDPMFQAVVEIILCSFCLTM